jgi:hypothetical protein
MTLPPSIRTREGETHQLEGKWSELPPGGPLRSEMLAQKRKQTQHACGYRTRSDFS